MLPLFSIVRQGIKKPCLTAIMRYSTLPPPEAPSVSSPTPKVSAKELTFQKDFSAADALNEATKLGNLGQTPVSSSDDPIGTTETLTEEQRSLLKKDPVLSLLVNLVMKDGEKAKAEKQVGRALYMLRQRTLRNPHEIMTAAIEKASPLMLTLSKKTGSKVIQVPVAIHQRKRFRIGINWIIAAAAKRRNPNFSHRLANEFIAILNGDSSVLAKKTEIHKLVLANRSNATVAR